MATATAIIRSNSGARGFSLAADSPQSGCPDASTVPEHDLVEIDYLGLGEPVTINAKARLCVDEGRGIAVDAIIVIAYHQPALPHCPLHLQGEIVVDKRLGRLPLAERYGN